MRDFASAMREKFSKRAGLTVTDKQAQQDEPTIPYDKVRLQFELLTNRGIRGWYSVKTQARFPGLDWKIVQECYRRYADENGIDFMLGTLLHPSGSRATTAPTQGSTQPQGNVRRVRKRGSSASAPETGGARENGKSRVLGLLLLCSITAVLFPPIGTQSSTYGHIRMSGFGILWELNGKVINMQLLALEVGVLCFFAYLLSRRA